VCRERGKGRRGFITSGGHGVERAAAAGGVSLSFGGLCLWVYKEGGGYRIRRSMERRGEKN
jgi:hypothetical protein